MYVYINIHIYCLPLETELDREKVSYGAAHLIGPPIRMKTSSTSPVWTTRMAVAARRDPHRRQARPCLHPQTSTRISRAHPSPAVDVFWCRGWAGPLLRLLGFVVVSGDVVWSARGRHGGNSGVNG